MFGKEAQVHHLELCLVWSDFTFFFFCFKSVKSWCMCPSSCPFFPVNYFWTHLTASVTLQEDRHPFLWTSGGWVLMREVLLRLWQCDILLYWHDKNSTGELIYECPNSDNSFTGAWSFLGTKVSQLQYSSLTVIRLY